MVRFVYVLAQRFYRLPNGHIHVDRWIAVVRDIHRIAVSGLQSPDKSGSRIRERVDGRELANKIRDSRIVHRRDQSTDINLRQVEGHGHILVGLVQTFVNKT